VLNAIGLGDRIDEFARAWALRITDLPPGWPPPRVWVVSDEAEAAAGS